MYMCFEFICVYIGISTGSSGYCIIFLCSKSTFKVFLTLSCHEQTMRCISPIILDQELCNCLQIAHRTARI